MPKIKIGQIGTAHGHASGKLEVYRKSSDYEVVGLVVPDEKLRRAAEKQPTFQGLPWLTVEQLLNVPGLQAVVVETEPRHLLAHAETCVDAGKHVHLDKPAGESLMQFRRILDTATRQHLCLQMGYMFRYHTGVVLMKDLVRKGFLGEVFEVHTVMSKVVDPANRLKHGEYSGGMMFELGCHVIDIVVDLLGQPETVTLSKERGKYKKGHQDVPVEPLERYVGDAADFAKVIRGEKTHDWSPMHDLAVQETVLKASGCPTDR